MNLKLNRNYTEYRVILGVFLILSIFFYIVWGIQVQRHISCREIAGIGHMSQISDAMTQEYLQSSLQQRDDEDYALGITWLQDAGYDEQIVNYYAGGSWNLIPWVPILAELFLFLLGWLLEWRKDRAQLKAVYQLEESIYRFLQTRTIDLPEHVLRSGIQQLMTQFCSCENRYQKMQSEMRDNFENLIHQCKTPLAGISLNIDLLLQKTSDQESRRMLAVCHQKTEEIRHMLSLILRTSMLEAGAARYSMQRHSLKQIIQKAVQECSAEMEDKEQMVRLLMAGDVECTCDHFWMEQAIINVLRNAIQYSDEGSVITCKVVKTDREISLEIRNPGQEISEAMRDDIFRKFYTEEGRETSGSGIGLYLAKKVITQHGGTLRILFEGGEVCFIFQWKNIPGKDK